MLSAKVAEHVLAVMLRKRLEVIAALGADGMLGLEEVHESGLGGLGQIWPYQQPRLLAEVLSAKLPASHVFAAPCLSRPHVTTTGEALVQVLLVHAGKLGEAAPFRRGDFCCHAPDGSDSLESRQAIRYESKGAVSTSGSLDNAGVETNNERRLRKLIQVCAAHGGHVAVATQAGLNPATLDQILKKVPLPPKKGDGSRSERALGDPAARAIEEAYKLGRGWFDNDGDAIKMSPKEMQLIGLFRELAADPILQEVVVENMRETVERRALLLEGARGNLSREKRGGAKPHDREKLVDPPATKRRAAQ